MMGRVSGTVLLLALGFGGVVTAQETPFQAETRFVTQTLPCKYVSMGGRTGPSYGAGHYDFACKGGTWGTVTLLLDNKTLGNSALDSVRLAYRSWDPAVNPTAGEAAVAEQFLQTLLNRYVPAADAPKVRQAFWGQRKASFKTGKTTSRLWQEEGQGYITQWLEIKAPALGNASAGLSMALTPMPSKPVQPLIGWGMQAPTPTDAGLLQPTQPQPAFTPALPQQPLNLPVPGSPTPAARESGLQVPANAPASAKTRGAAPQSLMETLGSTARSILGLPASPSPTSPLPSVANPASLNTAPAPESLTKPTPPPAISTSLVPAPEMVVGGRAPAPTNFAAYTEAERLTKDIEEKALGTAQKAMQSASGAMAVSASTPLGTPAPSLPAVPLPTLNSTITPTDAGLLKTPAAQPAAEPRFTPQRDLPQLKFIPKAEPLNTQNDVIRFEDEGSGL